MNCYQNLKSNVIDLLYGILFSRILAIWNEFKKCYKSLIQWNLSIILIFLHFVSFKNILRSHFFTYIFKNSYAYHKTA